MPATLLITADPSQLSPGSYPGKITKHSRLHQHPGIEFLYVLSGKLELSTREETHELLEGDSIYFDSRVPHGYRRLGAKRTKALVVTLGAI